MLTKIVARLKAILPTTVNVVPYGSSLPPAPYVVVRSSASEIAGFTNWNIIVHYPPGAQTFLEDMTHGNIATALDYYEVEDRHGNLNKLYPHRRPRGILPPSDDKTISMEQVYRMPGIQP